MWWTARKSLHFQLVELRVRPRREASQAVHYVDGRLRGRPDFAMAAVLVNPWVFEQWPGSFLGRCAVRLSAQHRGDVSLALLAARAQPALAIFATEAIRTEVAYTVKKEQPRGGCSLWGPRRRGRKPWVRPRDMWKDLSGGCQRLEKAERGDVHVHRRLFGLKAGLARGSELVSQRKPQLLGSKGHMKAADDGTQQPIEVKGVRETLDMGKVGAAKA